MNLRPLWRKLGYEEDEHPDPELMIFAVVFLSLLVGRTLWLILGW